MRGSVATTVAAVSEPATLAAIPGAIAFANFSAFALEFARAAQTTAIAPALSLLNETRLELRRCAGERCGRGGNSSDPSTRDHQHSEYDVAHKSSNLLQSSSCSGSFSRRDFAAASARSTKCFRPKMVPGIL